MSETDRGLFDTTREFATWEEFMQALKPKFLLHTVEYQLLVETHSWQMNGACPRFHYIKSPESLLAAQGGQRAQTSYTVGSNSADMESFPHHPAPSNTTVSDALVLGF